MISTKAISTRDSLLTALAFWLVLSSQAANLMAQYPAPIVYKETIATILEKADVMGWPPGNETNDWRTFGGTVASANGAKVLFSVCVHSSIECRPFVVNPDGTGKQDVSGIFPSTIANKSWGWGNYRINDSATEVFIRAQLSDSRSWIYFYDLASGSTATAVNHAWWSTDFDWFTLNSDATRFYVGELDWGWNEAAQRNVKGLAYADRNGLVLKYFDIHGLPCDALCNNLNALNFLGSSAQGDHTFFSWLSHYVTNAHPDNRSAMWHALLDGTAQKLTTEDHLWVASGDWRGISTADGSVALYQYRHRSGDPKEVSAVDVATGTELPVTWTSSLNPLNNHISRDGRYVFARGGQGDYGYHYNTLFDLDTDTARDSWSYHVPAPASYSNLTADNRYYFVNYDEALCRVDTAANQSGDFSQAPNITSIHFTAPYLWHDDSAQIGVTATVSDSQGLGNIAWVKLAVLVEGFEQPAFEMAREPLAFPTGDAGWVYLYDDGSHGDASAGDGVFTFDAIATRKGDYTGWNTWYSQFTLPHQVGVRIIAKDMDDNYTIADTTLWITEIDEHPSPIFVDGFELGDALQWSSWLP